MSKWDEFQRLHWQLSQIRALLVSDKLIPAYDLVVEVQNELKEKMNSTYTESNAK